MTEITQYTQPNRIKYRIRYFPFLNSCIHVDELTDVVQKFFKTEKFHPRFSDRYPESNHVISHEPMPAVYGKRRKNPN